MGELPTVLILTLPPQTTNTPSQPVTCGAQGDLSGYSPASAGPIVDGINYLLPSRTCTLAANSITRVSCSWSSGIFVQNRVSFLRAPPSLLWGIDADSSLAVGVAHGQCRLPVHRPGRHRHLQHVPVRRVGHWSQGNHLLQREHPHQGCELLEDRGVQRRWIHGSMDRMI